VHGQPAGIANRTGRREVSAQRVRELLGQFDVFLLFNAAANGDNNFRLREVDGLLRFFENFLRLIANYVVGDLHVYSFDRSRTGTSFSLVSAESAVLKGGKPRSLGCEAHVSREFSLEHLAGEEKLFAL